MIPENNSSENGRSDPRWEVQEIPFTSSVPIFGPIVVFVRNSWNSVATKWYVRRIVQQQNQYNRLLADLVEHCYTQLVEEDRETSEVIHDIAELATILNSINSSVQSLDERLSRLEQSLNHDGV